MVSTANATEDGPTLLRFRSEVYGGRFTVPGLDVNGARGVRI